MGTASSSEQDYDEQGCSLDLMCGIASLTSATTLITPDEPQGPVEGDMVRWRKIAPDGTVELKIGMVTKVVLTTKKKKATESSASTDCKVFVSLVDETGNYIVKREVTNKGKGFVDKPDIKGIHLADIVEVIEPLGNLRVRMLWGQDIEITVSPSSTIEEVKQLLISSQLFQDAIVQYPSFAWLIENVEHLRISYALEEKKYLDKNATLESLRMNLDVRSMRLEPRLFLVSTGKLLRWDEDDVSPFWLQLRDYSERVIHDNPAEVADQTMKKIEEICRKIVQKLGVNCQELSGMKGLGPYIIWCRNVMRESIGIKYLDELDSERDNFRNITCHKGGLVANDLKARHLVHFGFKFCLWCCQVPDERQSDINAAHEVMSKAETELTISPLQGHFTDMINDKTAYFTGRSKILGEICRRLVSNKNKFLMIRGDAGVGKSTVMCRMISEGYYENKLLCINSVKCIIGYHFCDGHNPITLDSMMFVVSLSRMLAQSLPRFKAWVDSNSEACNLLTRLSKHEPVSLHPSSVFRTCILNGLNSLELAESDTRVLVLDSMDESLLCSEGESASIAHVLRECISEFPSWLVIAASSRPSAADVLTRDANLLEEDDVERSSRWLDIDVDSQDNEKDIQEYIDRRLWEAFVQKHDGSSNTGNNNGRRSWVLLQLLSHHDRLLSSFLTRGDIARLQTVCMSYSMMLTNPAMHEDFKRRCLARIAGNFMYAKVLLDNIVSRVREEMDKDDSSPRSPRFQVLGNVFALPVNLKLANLPSNTLFDLYWTLFDMRFPETQSNAALVTSMFAVIIAHDGPISQQMLFDVLRVTCGENRYVDADLEKTLKFLEPYLRISCDLISFTHYSIKEWLLSPTASRRFAVKQGSGLMALWMWHMYVLASNTDVKNRTKSISGLMECRKEYHDCFGDVMSRVSYSTCEPRPVVDQEKFFNGTASQRMDKLRSFLIRTVLLACKLCRQQCKPSQQSLTTIGAVREMIGHCSKCGLATCHDFREAVGAVLTVSTTGIRRVNAFLAALVISKDTDASLRSEERLDMYWEEVVMTACSRCDEQDIPLLKLLLEGIGSTKDMARCQERFRKYLKTAIIVGNVTGVVLIMIMSIFDQRDLNARDDY